MEEVRKRPTPLVKDGHTIAVLRPADPARVVSETESVVKRQQSGELSPQQAMEALNEVGKDQERTFVGVVTTDQRIMHPDGFVIEGEQVQPGDIFVSYEELLASMS